MSGKDYPFDRWLRKRLKNPRFKKGYQRYELAAKLAAQISTLRKENNMTQVQLARKVKTVQEVISRLETAGRSNVTVSTLEKIAKAFHKQLQIRFI